MNHYQRVRNRVIEKLGAKCCLCGYNDLRALQIDHVNNDGNDHRRIHKAGSVQYMRDIEKSVDAQDGKFQVLCANCNTIKHFEDMKIEKVIKEQIKLVSLVDFTCELNRVIEEDKKI